MLAIMGPRCEAALHKIWSNKDVTRARLVRAIDVSDHFDIVVWGQEELDLMEGATRSDSWNDEHVRPLNGDTLNPP
ncbi:hypothetical protein AB1N83_006520 [Pleurotus pulmonarius]